MLGDSKAGLTDWITSGATLATAVLAGVGAWISYVGYRWNREQMMPRVEPDFYWGQDIDLGVFIKGDFWIVNRLDETLEITSLSVKRPSQANISLGKYNIQQHAYLPVKATRSQIECDYKIEEIGETHSIGGRSDRRCLIFYVFPPPKWLCGTIHVEIFFSSKALTIRNRRVVIKRRMAELPAKRTEDIANKTA